MPFRDAKVRRVLAAMLANIDGWYEAVAEIESTAHPGNKVKALHLMVNMKQARASLEHLIADAQKD
jgi:hypothetical protein